MIDPSSSEEETDGEGVEEPHHHHHPGHHSQQSQRAAKGQQDASGGGGGSSAGGVSNNSFGTAPGQLAGAGAGGNLGGGNGAGAGASSSSGTAATSWGGAGGASGSLDVPPPSGSLPRYVKVFTLISLDSFLPRLPPFSSSSSCVGGCLCPADKERTKTTRIPTPFFQKLIHVYRDVNADETLPSVSLFIFISSLFSNHLDLTTSKMAALDIRTPKTRRGVICTGIKKRGDGDV